MAPGQGHFPPQMCAKVPPRVLWSAAAGDTLGAAPPSFPIGGWRAGRGASQWPARLRRAAASRCRWDCASRGPRELSLGCRGAWPLSSSDSSTVAVAVSAGSPWSFTSTSRRWRGASSSSRARVVLISPVYPWTARRSNQSILKEINPEYSLEGLMLKLKL